jgi:hypothetical protein
MRAGRHEDILCMPASIPVSMLITLSTSHPALVPVYIISMPIRHFTTLQLCQHLIEPCWLSIIFVCLHIALFVCTSLCLSARLYVQYTYIPQALLLQRISPLPLSWDMWGMNFEVEFLYLQCLSHVMTLGLFVHSLTSLYSLYLYTQLNSWET